jgi:gas vesicle protein
MNTGKTIIGVVAGLAAGALLGVLFAPDKGTDTRRKISKKKKKYMKEIKGLSNDFMKGLVGKYNEVKEGVTEFAEEQKQKIERLKEV